MNKFSKADLIRYRLAKSDEVYKEAIDVAQMNHWNLAVNRLYYAIFHASTALLISTGNHTRTHAGTMRLIMLNYVKTRVLSQEEGNLISSLFNMRHTGDYDDLFDWRGDQIEPLMEPTKKLLKKIQALVIIPD